MLFKVNVVVTGHVNAYEMKHYSDFFISSVHRFCLQEVPGSNPDKGIYLCLSRIFVGSVTHLSIHFFVHIVWNSEYLSMLGNRPYITQAFLSLLCDSTIIYVRLSFNIYLSFIYKKESVCMSVASWLLNEKSI